MRRHMVRMIREIRKKMAVLSLSPPTRTLVRILLAEASTPAKPKQRNLCRNAVQSLCLKGGQSISWHSLFTGLLEEFAKCEISVSHPPFLEKVREKKTPFMRLIFISSSKGESKICILKSILEMKLAYKMCQYHFRTRNAKKVINNLICFIYL